MVKRTELFPGVFLSAVETKKFKTGCFSLNILRPLCRQEAAANALFPSVLLRGTERCPDIPAISAVLDELYGANVGMLIRKKGEVQTTGFYADFVEDRFSSEPVFSPLMHFLGELLLHPVLEDGAFRKDYFEGEKRNLLNTMDARINNKRTYANSCMLDEMCKDEAYSILRLGTRPELEALDSAALFRHYRRVLAESRLELFYMGEKSLQEVAEVLRSALRELPRAEAFTPVGTQVIPSAKRVQTVEKRMDVTQGKLSIGLRTGCAANSPDYPALVVMNTLFGACTTSKLFVKVREEQSLCYYAASALDRDKGLIIVYSGVETDQLETAKDAILLQLKDCQDGKITDEEFSSAKSYLLSDLRSAQDSPSRLDEYYLGQALRGGTESMEAYAERIAAVTVQQVQQAASRLTADTIFYLKGAEK